MRTQNPVDPSILRYLELQCTLGRGSTERYSYRTVTNEKEKKKKFSTVDTFGVEMFLYYDSFPSIILATT